MSIKIQQIDKKNYLVNNKPVYKEAGKWWFSCLINHNEASQFSNHLKTIKNQEK